MKTSDLSREELFVLVWERPTIEVAREFGISGVALGKLCRRLQVPKPPRGYWARVASGKTPRRPPLPAYRTEMDGRHSKLNMSKSQVRLSKLQLEFIKFALDELTSNGIDTGDCELAYDGIRSISDKTSAQILIILQTRYEKWLSDRITVHSLNAGMRSLSNLVDKLQPYAKDQLLVFHRKEEERNSYSDSPTISVRATDDFLGHIAHLSRLARDNGLAYITVDMSALDHAWSVRQIFSPRSRFKAKTELCVSSRDVWVRGYIDTWTQKQFETVRLPLRDICPIELISSNEQRLPGKIRRSSIKPYAKRLQALMEAQALYETLLDATYDMDHALPDERLALFDRLLFSREDDSPFASARQAWQRMDGDLDKWEQKIESEGTALCHDVLGIEIGDIAVAETDKAIVRLEIEGMSVYTLEKRIMFSVWGKRFRKDGLMGKRSEHITIFVENDMGSKV